MMVKSDDLPEHKLEAEPSGKRPVDGHAYRRATEALKMEVAGGEPGYGIPGTPGIPGSLGVPGIPR